MRSKLQILMEDLITKHNLPKFEVEYKPMWPEMKRASLDIAWPDKKVAVEVEGGIWVGGGHTFGKGFISDCNKHNLALMYGWKILRFTSNHIQRQPKETINIVKKLLE